MAIPKIETYDISVELYVVNSPEHKMLEKSVCEHGAVADQEGDSGGSPEHPSPSSVFKYPI